MRSVKNLPVLLVLAAVLLGAVIVMSSLTTNAATNNVITRPDSAGDVGRETSLEIDSSGRPVVGYFDATNSDLKLLRCGNATCTSSNVISSPDTAGSVGYGLSLELDSSQRPVVSYSDVDFGDLTAEVKILRCGDSTCSAGNVINKPDLVTVAFTENNGLALDSLERPVVSYWDQLTNDLKVLHCGDATCSSGNTVTTPTNGRDIALALDSSGNPILAYGSAGALKILHCDDVNCAGDESANITTPDASIWGGAALVLDGSGNPVLAYTDGDGSTLSFLHCDDPDCAGDESGNISSPATNGTGPSLELDADGDPVIAYLGTSAGDLQVLHCDDPDCAGDETGNTTTPDSIGSVGSAASLRLDGTGKPAISYYDNTLDDLKLIACADALCLGKPATPTPTPPPKDPDADTDGDTIINSADPDDDNDGCPDVQETQTAFASEFSGGLRNPHDANDYFNPSGDGLNRVDDIIAVVYAYFKDDDDGNPGLPPYEPGYNPASDRDNDPASPNAWNTGAPDGLQRVQDIIHALNSYFHDCA